MLMRPLSLEEAFNTVNDFRNPQGKRYKLKSVFDYDAINNRLEAL